MLERLRKEIERGREICEDVCPKCRGSGMIANDDDQTPWQYWLALPIESRAAIRLGLVWSITCPACQGTGRR